MTEIRSYHDKIAELKEYLVLNRNDEEGDSWIFGHNPTIENHLSSLNENEINELKIETQDGGDGAYYVISTERFAFDKPEELIEILNDFVRRFSPCT